MEKLSGGLVLSCGHRQVVSEHRVALARAGHEQHSVYCVECDTWSRLLPFPVTESDDTSQEEAN